MIIWNKLEKIYIKYIKLTDNSAINLINTIICIRTLGDDYSLATFNDFHDYVISNKLNNVLNYEFNLKWKEYFKIIVDEINHIEITDSTDIQNLGYLFEKLVNRRKTGTFYTPRDVTDYITKRSIVLALSKNVIEDDLFLHDIVSNKNPFELFVEYINRNHLLEETKKQLSQLKVLDPTCGSGAFLLAAFETIYKLQEIVESSKETLKPVNKSFVYKTLNSIYGVDIEPMAISITRCVLLLEILVCDGLNGLDYFPWNNFKVGNSLYNNPRNEKTNEVKPFIWNEEFKFDKFDCIIGNPPYIETDLARNEYIIDSSFKTLKCGNVYALILERSIELLKDSGVIGMIIPISFISTNRMDQIYQMYVKSAEYLFIASFADRPACLFSGVHQKLNIIFFKKGTGSKTFTTNYTHWYKENRNKLFNGISFIKNDTKMKIGSVVEKSIVNKVNKQKETLMSRQVNYPTEYKLYINVRAAFFIKTSLTRQDSKEFKTVYFADSKSLQITNSLLNSNLVFMLWEMFSDCWHVPINMDYVKFPWESLQNSQIKKLMSLSSDIENNLEKNKVMINSKQTPYEYKHKYAKHLMDEVDTVIAHLFGFSDKESEYIKRYNETYRLSDYYEEYRKKISA